MSRSLDGTCALPHLGVIRAQGEEAARFLHTQLTQDIALLRSDQARLAAFCNAKGRMLASFVGLKASPTEVLLVTSRDILPATLKRLSMFVLRAKCKLRDASSEFDLRGLAGAAAAPLAPWAQAHLTGGTAIGLHPADGVLRALWIAPAGTHPPSGPALDAQLWRWGEVRSGIATITAPVVDAFVPQMLNFESVEGVNFKKGCYPGQEVVARSQFRGTLKRRAFLAHSAGALEAGQEIVDAADPSQPCGMVVQSAPAPEGGTDAIVSIQLAVSGSATLHAGNAEGPAVALAPPPYPLLADI